MGKNFEEKIIDIEKNLRGADYTIRVKGREILKDFAITAPQFLALQYLIAENSTTIGELSTKMSLACSTITDLIDRMEKNELVTRFKDENDKRVVRVKAEKKGKDLVDSVLNKRRKYLSEKLSNFTEKEVEALNESLRLLFDAVNVE